MEEKILEHFGVEISGNWDEKCDFYIYEESTYDGYEVYVVTANPDTINIRENVHYYNTCLLYTSPSPRDRTRSRMPSSA